MKKSAEDKESGEEITLQSKVIKKGDIIICYDVVTALALLGLNSMDKGLFMEYKIDEHGDEYHVPISAMEKRKIILLKRKRDLEAKLEFMNQVLDK